MQAGAPIDPAGTASLAQKINSNPTWQMTTNPMYQQTLAKIQPYLQVGAQQNAFIAMQIQQQLQLQAAQEKAKKTEKKDDD
jgi:penicillin V acylase-like amidase (Ntn superfamily)